ncbi:MAG: hypothetical protein C4576_28130 [Desulfobacteraceae bacterium]|nr:MAG: hypothetical protein C4576_28130 [Desulfobacteraceae bacterium]
MSEISEDLVTVTWQAMGTISSAQARAEMAMAGREQPELLAFVLGSVSGCSPEAQELAVYLYFVIYKIFTVSAGKSLGPVIADNIELHLTRNEKLLERLEPAHTRFLERAAHLETRAQPFVVKYLVDAIMEAGEGEDAVQLSEEEGGTLYLVLKTTIDVLDEELARVESIGG